MSFYHTVGLINDNNETFNLTNAFDKSSGVATETVQINNTWAEI